MKPYYILGLLISLIACQQKEEATQEMLIEEDPQAQAIVDSAIIRHGMEALDSSHIAFDFRGKHYKALRVNGSYDYFRIFTDKEGREISDHLTNDRFVRTTNGDTTVLADKKASAYRQSVNSVIYFALLPYFLNDGAVYKQYMREITIKGKAYHQIKVTFSEEGGGDDADDVFLYWFDTKTYQMDYLAYKYHTNEGGVRLREAYNQREINGVEIADFINWKAEQSIDFENIASLFGEGKLEELSRIELENVQID